MKLKSEFKNKYSKIHYRIYELDNGIAVIHLENPTTIDFDFSIVARAGSFYETKESVPKGTAHFLEHMFFNPNTYYKTKSNFEKFEAGNRQRPRIYINAGTTRKNIYLTGHSNHQGSSRVVERVANLIDFPKGEFTKFLEKEREVILAEKSGQKKQGKNPMEESIRFLLEDSAPEFVYSPVGEIGEIKKVTLEDLHKYFIKRFTTGNTIFAIQENVSPSPSLKKKLEEVSKRFVSQKADEYPGLELENRFKIGFFYDDTLTGVNAYLFYFEKEEKDFDYKYAATKDISYELINKLAFDILREKEGLIYNLSTFERKAYTFGYNIQGISFISEIGKFSKTLESLHTILEKDIFEFLNSQRGKDWFLDVLSTFIYPRTVPYNSKLTEDVSSTYLERGEVFNNNIYVKEAKKVTVEDVKRFLRKRFNTPPHIWLESGGKKKELEKVVKDSSFGKRFG
jgi:predicted Zn-dependent peptidase